MVQEQAKQLLQKGIAAARDGRPDVARQMLRQAARLEPQHEAIWMWLSSVAEDGNERLFCLKKILEINPGNTRARQGLQALGIIPDDQPAEQMPRMTVPVLDDDRYSHLQHAADDFLHHYNPEPVDHLDIQWVHKQKRRYGEGGATRLRQGMYALTALALVLLVGSLILMVDQISLPSLGGEKVTQQVMRIFSPTPRPTLTPTQGGPTPTPFVMPMAVPPTIIPAGLVRHKEHPDDLIVPTEIYPDIHPNIRHSLVNAVNHYSIGEYETAIEMLREERERVEPHCYPSVVYYEALSHTALGDYREARDLLTWARNHEPPRLYESCQDTPLLLTAQGELAYSQGDLQGAVSVSEQALAEDARLVQASIIKAQAELDQDQIAAAQGTITQALIETPQDTNLLVMAAEIELANEQPGKALDYIGQTLFIEPALHSALYLQPRAYLMLAEQSSPETERQIQYYGLSVISAQELLLYYPGDPAGYFYLAQARMGEQNYDLAETAFNRLLAVEANLPDNSSSIVQAAYRTRGELYYQQGRFEAARDDFEEVVFTASNALDPTIAPKLVDIAFALGDYSDADDWLNQLRAVDPVNASYRLLHARVRVEICTFDDKLACEYRDTLAGLSDTFVAGLGGEDQRAEAYAYRAQARYWETQRRGQSLSAQEREVSYQQALVDVLLALATRESAVDHYYQGLILEELSQPEGALEAYQWIVYWNDLYPYPFVDDDFDRRVARVADLIDGAVDAEATVVPDSVTSEVSDDDTAGATSTPDPDEMLQIEIP